MREQPATKIMEHSTPYQSFNISGGRNENADSDIFFEMDGLDGADVTIGGNNMPLQQRYDNCTGSYDNPDDEDENTYGMSEFH